MHILVVNDDGPPSIQASPYIHSFVQALQTAGHLVSVVLPHQQRSWIGKAHFVGQVTKPTYFQPGMLHQDDGTTYPRPVSMAEAQEEWVLVDGTPATCAQLGIFHFFQDRPPVDLVVSGPNYGRNSTALFSLSSGTIGGAMEAAVCRKKAIALSFAFYSREHTPTLIAEACRHSVQLVEHLYKNWGHDVDLYSCNVPLIPEIAKNKIMYTHALQNYWASGSSFQEIEATEDENPQIHEREIRVSGESATPTSKETTTGHKHRHFKWAPNFADIQKSIDESPPGNDGWAIHQGYTSVTPLKANFLHATGIPLGELKLSPSIDTALQPQRPTFYAIIEADEYLLPLILLSITKCFPTFSYQLISTPSHLPSPIHPLLQIRPYESIDFDHLLGNPTTSFANSYIIRKALIRKHYLWQTISSWWSKHPDDTTLKGHVPLTINFELDYAEFLDEALVECFELHESFASEEPEWWVLKPAMSDQGQGIRLFNSEASLRSIFEEWEEEANDEAEGSEGDETTPAINGEDRIGAGTMTSQLRHFVAQRYISRPLLFREFENRKFHLRSYVLAVGALRVYVYKELLALFAPSPYAPPTAESLDAEIHLTNTCLYSSTPASSSIALFSALPTTSASNPLLPQNWKDIVFAQISTATATLFEAAAREQMIHFQALPNAFEVFGVDWLVDESGNCWLLEVNAFPDFKQSGEVGREVVKGLWERVLGLAVGSAFGGPNGDEKDIVKVLDVDFGRR